MNMMLRGDGNFAQIKMMYQHPRNVRIRSKLLHLHHPLLYVFEADLVGHIKDDDDPQGPPVAAGQNWPVSLLAPCVPHLPGEETSYKILCM